jgi:predicted small integral membrane protein
MTFECTLLIAQGVAVFFLAAWLTTGAYENLFYSDLNRTFTSEVLDFTRMREEYPDAYSLVSYRRVSNPVLQTWLFRGIVAWEVIAVLALWCGVIAFGLAVMGMGSSAQARALGLLGALLFTCTWAGFLIVGNWFCYWFCHDGAQNTHFQMTLWGIATMIFLATG